MAPNAMAQESIEQAGTRLVRPRPGLWVRGSGGCGNLEGAPGQTAIETQLEGGNDIPYLWVLGQKR